MRMRWTKSLIKERHNNLRKYVSSDNDLQFSLHSYARKLLQIHM